MGSPMKNDRVLIPQKAKPRILKPCDMPVLFSDPINLFQIKKKEKKPQLSYVTKQKLNNSAQANLNKSSQLTSKPHNEKHGEKLRSPAISSKTHLKTYTAKATVLTSQPIMDSPKSKSMKTPGGNETLVKAKHKKLKQDDHGKQQHNGKIVKPEKVKTERCTSPVTLKQNCETDNCRNRTYSRHSDPGDNVFDNIMNDDASGDAPDIAQDNHIKSSSNVKPHPVSKSGKTDRPVVHKVGLIATVKPRVKHEQSVHNTDNFDEKSSNGSPIKSKTNMIDRNINFPHPVSRMKRECSPVSITYPKKRKRIKCEVEDEHSSDMFENSDNLRNTNAKNGHRTPPIKEESISSDDDEIKTASDSPQEDDSGSDSDTSSSSVSSCSSSTTSSSSSSSESEPSSPEHTVSIQNIDDEKLLAQESHEKNVENSATILDSAKDSDDDDENEKNDTGLPFIPSASYFQALPEDLRILDSFPFTLPKFRKYVHVETCPNGEASVLHAYQHELNELSENERELFADDFCRLSFLETKPYTADFVMGIVHDAIADQPDYLEYFADKHGDMTVKAEVLGQRDILTMSIGDFRRKVHETYSKTSGMYR